MYSQRKCTISNRFVTVRLLFDDILYVQKDLRRVLIVTNQETYWEYCSLPEILSRMDTRFCPCNRSLAINLNQVRKVFNGRIFMNEIGEIDVSRATYFLIKKALNNYEIKDD